MSGRHEMGAACLVIILAAGCGQLAFPPSGSPVHPVLMNLTDSSTGFGLALTDRLLGEPNADNVFISPLSATLALSMAASAAHGDTRAAMLTALGLDPAVDPSAQAKLTIDRLTQSDANAQLELAQAVWAKEGLSLDPAYVARLRSDYQAQLANLDFSSPGAPKVVNDWVDNATHHKITQLVDRFDPQTVAYLVNATYFHALWATEFKPSTEQGSFTTFSGASVGVEMMERGYGVTNVVMPDYEAVLLPYKGGRFSMVILLPRKVLAPAEFSRFLTRTTWNQVLSAFHDGVGPSLGGTCVRKDAQPNLAVDCDGGLVMPKFTLDYSAELLPALVKMGMPVGELPDICSGCFISRVVQKTHLEVDEKGTSAAAATGVAVATSLRLPMVVDHPFALALIDNASDAPLFMGVIGSL
jgi:serine protease inhibitor